MNELEILQQLQRLGKTVEQRLNEILNSEQQEAYLRSLNNKEKV